MKSESGGGILLLFMAVCALLIRNLPLVGHYYEALLEQPVHLIFGQLEYVAELEEFIDDGLMTIFFLLVGLEVKREILEGELSQPKHMILPAIAALGGMLVPMGIYLLINASHADFARGCAIPSATDIAFAVGVLSLFGRRVPLALKMFLLTLAVLDDLGAVIIIALFYSSGFHLSAIIWCGIILLLMFGLNRLGVALLKPYMVMLFFLWFAMLNSGIHATLAGVLGAFTIPLRKTGSDGTPPLVRLGNELQGVVTWGILPAFAFVNSGIPLVDIEVSDLFSPITFGVSLGLFLGKQLGVFAFSFLACKTGIAQLPRNVSWLAFYGVAILCGIGFTMSLFIATLAFPIDKASLSAASRIGILTGSFISAVCGYFFLNRTLPALPPSRKPKKQSNKIPSEGPAF